MDSILANQLEWLLSGNMEGIRFRRQLLLLAGCLADHPLPEHIEREISSLAKRIALEEVFDALISPVNAYLRNAKDKELPALDLTGLIKQIDAAREALQDCEPVNQAAIISWLIAQAREKRILNKIRGSR